MKKRKNNTPKNPVSSICLYFKYSQKIYKTLYQSKDYIIRLVKNFNFPLTNKEKFTSNNPISENFKHSQKINKFCLTN